MRALKRGRGSPDLEMLFRDGVPTGLTDKDLLERFTATRDPSGELAFTTLVARHGPMVLSVCRRILQNPADADDAFQATFLVLVRRAGSIRFGTSLGPWLYGVSVRVARRLRAGGTRRSGVGSDGDALEAIPDPAPGVHAGLDLRLAIDEGLDHLPDGYRAAVVLCHLEGLTHEEAADRLNCPVGTVRSRLARGRALLRGHLERLGLGAPDGVSRPGSRSDRAGAPPIVAGHLIQITARAAARLAAGQPLAETVSARLAGIVAGVARAMMLSKLAMTSSLLIVAGIAAWGVSVGLAASQGPDPQSATARVATPASPSRTVAVAQAPAARSKMGKVRGTDPNTELDLKLLAELPAVVLSVEPKVGATDVDPDLREIRVTFSKPMIDKSWSWTSGNVYAFPKADGPIHYEKDRRTCVMPVKLEPGKTYVMGINSERFHNFKDVDGRPASPYLVAFRTRAKR
jgi:RNA polymerase sigma factor (sigma-70 family)